MSVRSLLKTKWHSFNPLYKKYGRAGCCAMLFVFLIIFYFVSLNQALNIEKNRFQLEEKRTVMLTEEMNGLRVQVEKLASTQNPDQFKQLGGELENIEKNVSVAAKSTELKKIAVDIDSRLDALEKMVVGTGENKKYLDSKVLPFQVMSVDVIAGQPFVSVNDHHQIMPLSVGDSLEGWKIVNADYQAMTVEFENEKGQCVKVAVFDRLEMAGGTS